MNVKYLPFVIIVLMVTLERYCAEGEDKFSDSVEASSSLIEKIRTNLP